MHVVAVDPGSFLYKGSRIFLPERSYLGYVSYKEYLKNNYPDVQFSVVCVDEKIETDEERVAGLYSCDVDEINFVDQKAIKYLSEIDEGAVVLTLFKNETADFVNLPHKIIYLLEVTPSIRWGIYSANMESRILSAAWFRVRIGLIKKEILARRVIRRASGLQLNGPAAYGEYKNLVDNSILFFDHRVKEVRDRRDYLASHSMRFAFSGRLIEIKGADYLGKISQVIYNQSPLSPFYIIGDGPDRQKFLQDCSPSTIYKGFMEYSSEWEPFVRQNVDVMVLPHVQGDPSMTYFEALGQGVPILSFENETSNFLVEQGVGWTVPRGDMDSLEQLVHYLIQHPEEVQEKSEAAAKFMSANLYDDMVEKRMEHVMSVASRN